MYVNDFAEILKAKRAPQFHTRLATASFDFDRHAAASRNKHEAAQNLDAVFAKICAEEEKPNCDQLAFLEHLVCRLNLSILEHQQDGINVTATEPLLDVVHGFPGAGKSHVIKWMCVLMPEGLGW